MFFYFFRCKASITNSDNTCRIGGSHSGGYEEYYLLGYNAV
jgi:hypothetical protein